MATETPHIALRLRLGAPATPERVEIVARLFARILRSAAPSLPPDSFTLVIDNLNLVAGVRPQNADAQRVLEKVRRVIGRPEPQVKHWPMARDVARALAGFGDDLIEAGTPAAFEHGRGQRVMVDAEFTREMRAASRYDPDRARQVRGRTTVASKILRVGRSIEEKAPRARIRMRGRIVDLAIMPPAMEAVFDAAKADREVLVELDAVWRADAMGEMEFDLGSTRIVGIDPSFSPVSGRELIEEIRATVPSIDSWDLSDLQEDEP